MELFQDLVLTASIALILSFLVAQLLSFAMAADAAPAAPYSELKNSKSDYQEVLLEEMVSGERLTVSCVQGEKRVEFIEENIETVDKFEPTPVLLRKEAVDRGYQIVKVCCREPEKLSEKDLGEQSRIVVEEICRKGPSENIYYEEKEAKSRVLVEEIEVRTDNNNDDFVVESEEIKRDGLNEEMEKGFLSDEDDWEGIERSELEKTFHAAAKFVGDWEEGDRMLASPGSDLQMKLYGLHKVAIEGPCREPQPMALMVSARTKWNAWQRLGNMNPDMAMERYIEILSNNVPGWIEDNSFNVISSRAGMDDTPDPNSSIFSQCEPKLPSERNTEMVSSAESGDLTEDSNLWTG